MKTLLLALLVLSQNVFAGSGSRPVDCPPCPPCSEPSPAVTPTITPTPEPTVTPTPIPTEMPSVTALETFERPEYAKAEDWKSTVKRTILDGQVTSFILKADKPCSLVQDGVNKMLQVHLTKASAPTYSPGVYYDALVSLTAENCSDAKFMQVDVSGSRSIGGLKIEITKKVTKAPALPKVPLNIELNNWTMTAGFCGSDSACRSNKDIERLALVGSQILKEHRISTYKGHPYAGASYAEWVLPYQIGPEFVGFGGSESYMPSTPTLPKPWAYVMDEVVYSGFTELATRLEGWKSKYPSVARMVTTPLRHKDLQPGSPTFAKVIPHTDKIRELTDIFVPVAENFCVETWKGSRDLYPCREEYTVANKRLWMYVSNMSHGAEGGPATGAADLVIDRSAVEAFGFFGYALKWDIEALLYYNSIEGWGRTDLLANPYIFGGQGDGLLLYPDKAGKKFIPSIRLKLIREASQWADILLLAGKKPDALFRSTLDWDRDLKAFESLRSTALESLP